MYPGLQALNESRRALGKTTFGAHRVQPMRPKGGSRAADFVSSRRSPESTPADDIEQRSFDPLRPLTRPSAQRAPEEANGRNPDDPRRQHGRDDQRRYLDPALRERLYVLPVSGVLWLRRSGYSIGRIAKALFFIFLVIFIVALASNGPLSPLANTRHPALWRFTSSRDRPPLRRHAEG